MERQQGARRVGDLRLERGALIGEPPKRRVGDRRTCVGDLRFAFEPAQQLRPGRGRGLGGARFGKLRIEVGQRIAGWRRRFVARRRARLRADRLDLRLGVGDPAFPVRDLLSEPGLDRARRLGPGFVPGLHDEIRDRIGAARGKPRIARNEGDRDRARARRRRNRQPRQERLDGAAVRRAGAARKPQSGERGAREIRRRDRQGLGRRRGRVGRCGPAARHAVEAGKGGLRLIEQGLGEAGVARRDGDHEDRRADQRGERRAHDPAPAAAESGAKALARVRRAAPFLFAGHGLHPHEVGRSKIRVEFRPTWFPAR